MDINALIAGLHSKSKEQQAQMRSNAERILVTGTDKARKDARRLLDALDAEESKERTALITRVAALPMSQRVVEAFTHQPMTETEYKVVQVLLDNPGRSSSGLSELLGWGGQIWHTHFGLMCRSRETRLWLSVASATRDANFYCGILADYSDVQGWRMKPEVAVGLAVLGVRPKVAVVGDSRLEPPTSV